MKGSTAKRRCRGASVISVVLSDGGHGVRVISLPFGLAFASSFALLSPAPVRSTSTATTAATTRRIIGDHCLVNWRRAEFVAVWFFGAMAAQAAKVTNVQTDAIPSTSSIRPDCYTRPVLMTRANGSPPFAVSMNAAWCNRWWCGRCARGLSARPLGRRRASTNGVGEPDGHDLGTNSTRVRVST